MSSILQLHGCHCVKTQGENCDVLHSQLLVDVIQLITFHGVFSVQDLWVRLRHNGELHWTIAQFNLTPEDRVDNTCLKNIPLLYKSLWISSEELVEWRITSGNKNRTTWKARVEFMEMIVFYLTATTRLMWQKFSMFFFLHCYCDQKYTARSNYCFILQLYGRYCKQKHII